jgi:hypothetical protein
MQRSHRRRRVVVPTVTAAKSPAKDYTYTQGFNTNLANDEVAEGQWRYVTDARMNQIGKWSTKQGADLFSVPIGEVVNAQQAATTGAGVFNFNTSTWWAKKVTATSSGRLTAIEANLKNPGGATGTVVYVLYTDNSGTVGTELFRTSVANNGIATTAAYVKARSISCPDIVSGVNYWVVGYVQTGGSGSYQITTTTAATTGLTSTNAGTTWNTSAFDFNVKLSTATASGVKGHIRIRRPSGAAYSFFAVDTTLYSVNETTGATTAVDTAIGSTSTYVRFAFVNDILYYVDGTQKPRRLNLDTMTASSVTACPENASNIIVHKAFLFFQAVTDPNKSFTSDMGSYESFGGDRFEFYVDAPRTADATKAYVRLNGNLYIVTRNNKYILYGNEVATFRLDNAVGQKGTFSQASVAYNESSLFLASDDGIYQFNGAEEKNIATDVLDWWKSLTNKQNTVLDLYNNRLYVYYTPVGQSQNSACRIYNLLYGTWESEDTRTYVATSYTRYDADNYMLIGSNRVGMLMINEQPTNDYTNLGEPLSFELRTHYDPTIGSFYHHPVNGSNFKRVVLYRPHFDTITGSYSIQMGYAFDYSEQPQYSNIALTGGGVRFDTGVTFNSGAVFGGLNQVNPLDNAPQISGKFRRLQIRYKHYAAREPVSFDGHVLSVESQRAI